MMSLIDQFLQPPNLQDPIASLAMDIEDLLNHTRSSQPWSDSHGPSALNYGVPNWVGKPMSPKFISELALQIKKSLILFEPRIDAQSLHVQAHPRFISSLGVYKIEIHGRLSNSVKLPKSMDQEIDWFIHIDPHYGVAKIQVQPALISIGE